MISGIPSPSRSAAPAARWDGAEVLSASVCPKVIVWPRVLLTYTTRPWVSPWTLKRSILPSPLKSAKPDTRLLILEYRLPAGTKAVEVSGEPPPVKVTSNAPAEAAVRPPVVTVKGLYVVPPGTATVRVLAVAVNILAFIPPKLTRLAAVEAPKPEPLIVTTVPMGPFAGVKLFITGCAKQCKVSTRAGMARRRSCGRKVKANGLGGQTSKKNWILKVWRSGGGKGAAAERCWDSG
jgi:hypothetical protein